MMDEQGQQPSSVPFYLILAMVGTASGLYLIPKALESARPPPIKPAAYEIKVGEVDARLWEDPLAAVYEDGDKSQAFEDTGGGKTALRNDLEKLEEEGSLLVLPVEIADGFGAEAHEARLRTRYAVLAALDVAGYSADRWKTLRYLLIEKGDHDKDECDAQKEGQDKKECDTEKETELVIPFETFQRNSLNPPPLRSSDKSDEKAEAKAVLVLWVEAGSDPENPYERLKGFLEQILPNASAQDTTGGQHPPIRFLGPVTSDGLKKMLDHEPTEWLKKDFEAYSSWATADPLLLDPEGKMARKSTIPKESWIELTIPSDRQLVKGILEELDRRGIEVNPCDKESKTRVALVSEWDTFYGRALPLTFAAYARARCEIKGKHKSQEPELTKKQLEDHLKEAYEQLQSEGEDWPAEILRASYLQGLDGQTTRRRPEDSDARTSPRSNGDSVKEMARPDGQSQLDYVRRLADDLHRSGEPHEIKAIGVLGSDVYDKLLLLQALRDLFPHAVFFTTDLDARLLHPTETEWARNLVIASSFGLRLTDTRQLEAEKSAVNRYDYARLAQLPPFRDAYQTSIFFATLKALDALPPKLNAAEPHNDREETDEEYLKRFADLKLYEVGRTRPIRLNSPSDDRELWPTYLRLTLLFAFAFALGALIRRLRWEGRVQDPFHTGIASYLPVTFALILVVVTVALATSSPVEPFELTEGVSIWPTEILRLLATFVAIYYLVRNSIKIRRNNEAIEEEFCLPKQPASEPRLPTPTPPRPFVRWVLSHALPTGGDPIDIARLWSDYLLRGKQGYRWVRTLALSLLYLGLGFSLMELWGRPTVPYRGAFAHHADSLILFLNVSSFILLMFYVVDAVLLTERLVQRLRSGPTKWPVETIEKWSCDDRKCSKFLAEWLDIRLIAMRTEEVGSLVTGPFIVLFLMIISRLTYFDRWDWPLSLVAIISLNSLYAIVAAAVLRRSAERTRNEALNTLREERIRCLAKGEDRPVRLLDRLLDEIKSLSRGAFAPITQQPIVRAFLVPFGGIGIAVFLEFLATTQW